MTATRVHVSGIELLTSTDEIFGNRTAGSSYKIAASSRIEPSAFNLTMAIVPAQAGLEPASRREPGECSGAHSLNRQPSGA